MACLDTDLLVGILRSKPEALEFVEKLEESGGRRSTTLFNAQELWKGAFLRGEAERRRVEEMLAEIDLLLPTEKSAKSYGALAAKQITSGGQLPDADLMIASVAIEHGETLVTRNEKHFSRIPGLKVQKW